MKMRFNVADLRRIVTQAESADKHRAVFGQDGDRPGLWLVGDDGVYLMANCDPPVMADGTADVVYAEQFKETPKDEWWDLKRSLFGGDDGVEFLDLDYPKAAIEAGRDLCITLTSASMTLTLA